jgi:small conductance mechanosensitive channel
VAEAPEQIVELAITLLSTWGLQVVGAIAVLLIGRIVAGGVRSALRRALERRSVDSTLIPFASGLAYYFVLAVVLIAVLSLFGIETTSLVAILGAAGLAVGLALQGTLSNFAAGVMLLVLRPFRVGDVIEAAGSLGKVQEIGIFSTTLNTPDNVRIIIPNSAVFAGTIKNVTANGTRRNDLVFGISYGDDVGRAITAIEGVLQANERVLDDPAPAVFVAELADSSVNLAVRPWCATPDYMPLRGELMRAVRGALEAADCSIPFPQRDLHVVPAAVSKAS